MNFLQKNIGVILIFILGICFGFLGNQSLFGKNKQEISIHKEDIFASPKIDEAKEIIKKEYYHFDQKSKFDIENAMIQSIVGSLGDRHSSYFSPKEAKDFTEVLRGDFEGIGAVIDEHMKGIIIRKVFPLSPASKSGLQDGDILTRIGKESIVGLSVEQAVKKIRGPKGSQVEVTYLRGEKYIENTIFVTRDMIVIPSTQEKMLSGSLGYLEVAFFGDHTREEFQTSLQNLTASGAKGIILDFRNNGGGYLESAVDVLSFLLPDKVKAVTTRENDPKKTETLLTKKTKDTNENIPLVMIVNSLSASATEIVAGALQDYSRAIIVGEKSYGKGSVQSPFILQDGSILKVTIGKWYTPNDRGIDGSGITSDISIPLFDRDFTTRYDRQLEGAKKTLEELIKTKNYDTTIETMKQQDFTK